MKIKQLYTNCLAQGAYYISHNGEAASIDPLRETAPYLELLSRNGDKLKYIFETHFPGQSRNVVDFWMPNKTWENCNVNDPSARVLPNYGKSGD